MLVLLKYLTGIGIPCLFYELTGLHCPGCGNTHAFMELLHFRFQEALAYNYLFPAEFIYIFYTIGKSGIHYLKTGEKKLIAPPDSISIPFLICLIIWFFVRNLLHI